MKPSIMMLTVFSIKAALAKALLNSYSSKEDTALCLAVVELSVELSRHDKEFESALISALADQPFFLIAWNKLSNARNGQQLQESADAKKAMENLLNKLKPK